jgi:hypothetical protein
MGNNKRVSEETFGSDVKSPSISGGGKIVTFGHTVVEGQAIPSRGTSVNVKTGYPVKGGK